MSNKNKAALPRYDVTASNHIRTCSEAVALRVAASAWGRVAKQEPRDDDDIDGQRAWKKLALAAVAFARKVTVSSGQRTP